MTTPSLIPPLTVTEPTVLRLNVTGRKQIAGGRSKGREWTLYAVEAVTENGEALDRVCLSFYVCRKGLGEYELTPQERDGHDPSYMLKPLDAEDPGDVLERIVALEEKVLALSRIVYGREEATP